MTTDQDATLNDVITTKPKGEHFVLLVLSGEVVLLILFYFLMPRSSNEVNRDLDVKLKEMQGQEVKVNPRFVFAFY